MNNLPKVPRPPLSKVVINEPILDVDTSATQYFQKNYKNEMTAGIIFVGLWEITIVFFVFRHLINGHTISEDGVEGIFLLIALPFFVAFGIFASLKNRLLQQFYQQFARANGFSYQKKGWLENRQGAIFKVGHSAAMENIVSGQLNNLPINLFNYHYTVGSGKSAQTFQKTILELGLTTLTPPMLLLVDWHGFGDDISDNNIKNVSKISLSESLEKHFNLFAERKFEMEALQIFTPDFLNLIYEKYKQFSLDFCGSKLYVYSSGVIAKKAELDLMVEFLKILTERLGQKLGSMQGSILALTEAVSKAPRSGFGWAKVTNLASRPLLIPILLLLFGIGIAVLATVLMSIFK